MVWCWFTKYWYFYVRPAYITCVCVPAETVFDLSRVDTCARCNAPSVKGLCLTHNTALCMLWRISGLFKVFPTFSSPPWGTEGSKLPLIYGWASRGYMRERVLKPRGVL